jgi:hypothetical protein
MVSYDAAGVFQRPAEHRQLTLHAPSQMWPASHVSVQELSVTGALAALATALPLQRTTISPSYYCCHYSFD